MAALTNSAFRGLAKKSNTTLGGDPNTVVYSKVGIITPDFRNPTPDSRLETCPRNPLTSVML